jgi:hypothetical protein
MEQCEECHKPLFTFQNMLHILRGVMPSEWDNDTRNKKIGRSLHCVQRQFLSAHIRQDALYFELVTNMTKFNRAPESINFPVTMDKFRRQETASIIFRMLYRTGEFKYYRWINEINQSTEKQHNVTRFLDIMSILKALQWDSSGGVPTILYSLRNRISEEDMQTLTFGEVGGRICTTTSTMSCTTHAEVMSPFACIHAQCIAKLVLTIPSGTTSELFIDMRNPAGDHFATSICQEEQEIVLRPGIVFQITHVQEIRANGRKTRRMVAIFADVLDVAVGDIPSKDVHMGACQI